MNTQDQIKESTVLLPIAPENPEDADMGIYARFMQHLRCVPNSRMDIKVLSAIQFTADMMDYSDAHISKILVEFGLRAPRMAFPAEFLSFADQSLIRDGWAVGGPSKALKELQTFWYQHGEDRFAAFKGDYPLLEEGALV
ncbi:MAG: hypothetical protein AAF204_00490 [Pseudomonadota bacterium]